MFTFWLQSGMSMSSCKSFKYQNTKILLTQDEYYNDIYIINKYFLSFALGKIVEVEDKILFIWITCITILFDSARSILTTDLNLL